MEKPNQVELHTMRPDGSFIMNSGPYAGLRAKIMGNGSVVKNNQVVIHHHEPLVPYYFDPGNSAPPDPVTAREQLAQASANTRVQEEKPKQMVETFKTSMPQTVNPWADLQIEINDDDDLVTAEIIEERELTPAEANQATELEPEELLEMLATRDLTEANLTPEEFNALKLNKKQLYQLYEQIFGQTTNKPTVDAAIRNIIKRANTNSANYARTMSAIKRVKERTN